MPRDEFTDPVWITTKDCGKDDPDKLYIPPDQTNIEQNTSVSHSRFARSPDESYTAVTVNRNRTTTHHDIIVVFEADTYIGELTVPLGDGVRNIAVSNPGIMYFFADYDETSTLISTEELPTPDQDARAQNLLIKWKPGHDITFIDAFVSEMQWIATTPPGDHVAALTSPPDFAAHMYTNTGEYRGGVSMPPGAIHIRFEDSDPYLLHGYGPNISEPKCFSIDADQFTNPLRRTNLHAIAPTQDDPAHLIHDCSIPDDITQLRLPDLKVETLCGYTLSTINAYRIYDDPDNALNAGMNMCDACSNADPLPMKHEDMQY